MDHLLEQKIDCPYCGETIDVLIDPTEAVQIYIEDCQVCCQPISFHVEIADDSAIVSVQQENA